MDKYLLLMGMLFTAVHGAWAQKSNTGTEKTVAVNIGMVERVNVPDTIYAVGHLLAIKQVDLSFNNDGTLAKIFFKNGDRVLEGESVAALNDQEDAAKLQDLQAQLDLARQTYNRVKILESSGAISKEDIDQKYAALKQAEAQVKQQQVVLAQDQLKAPFSGVLGTFQYSSGAYIASGSNVVQLTQEDPLKIRYAVPSDLKPKIAIGNKVTLTSTTYPDQIFHGVVNYISPTVNMASGTIDIEAEVENNDYLLSPGMFMSVSQTVKSRREILVVPDMAIQVNQDGNFVYVVEKNDTVQSVAVKTGLISQGWTEITSGVKEGQRIVIIGGNKLMDGEHVVESDIPPPPFDRIAQAVKLHVGNPVDSPAVTSKGTPKS
ncbi:MAG: efflux RND transporter periplasmic adaptor subunit [Francisellaceae bacterium]